MHSKIILQQLLLALLVVCSSLHSTDAAKKKGPIPSREDLKYIGCEVCEKMAINLKSAIDELAPFKPRKTLMEYQVLEPIESVCNPHNATGEWIRRQDIVESSKKGLSYLNLVEPGGVGKCGVECVTIAKSCQNLLDEELDVDELAQAFLKKTKFTAGDWKQKICASMTKRCFRPPMHMDPKNKRLDAKFEQIDEKELETEKLMASMKSMGLGAQMYGRDDMDDLMAMRGAAGDDDEDDEGFASVGLGGMPEVSTAGGDSNKPFQNAGDKYEL